MRLVFESDSLAELFSVLLLLRRSGFASVDVSMKSLNHNFKDVVAWRSLAELFSVHDRLSTKQIYDFLPKPLNYKTLQRRLKSFVERGLLVESGIKGGSKGTKNFYEINNELVGGVNNE